jgi:hypothetical protein
VPLPLADATNHLGEFAIVMLLAFCVGVYGQITRSRAIVLMAIVVIALITLYFVEVGEVSTFNR